MREVGAIRGAQCLDRDGDGLVVLGKLLPRKQDVAVV
jgi:hypothetical protein